MVSCAADAPNQPPPSDSIRNSAQLFPTGFPGGEGRLESPTEAATIICVAQEVSGRLQVTTNSE